MIEVLFLWSNALVRSGKCIKKCITFSASTKDGQRGGEIVDRFSVKACDEVTSIFEMR